MQHMAGAPRQPDPDDLKRAAAHSCAVCPYTLKKNCLTALLENIQTLQLGKLAKNRFSFFLLET